MNEKFDPSILDAMIRGYNLVANGAVPVDVNQFVNGLVFVVNSCEQLLPAQCAKIEQMIVLCREQKIYLQQVAGHIAAALKEIEEQYGTVYKAPKIFISHATADAVIVEKLVSLLEDIGVQKNQLFCSSTTGYGIPQGAGDLYDHIRDEMSNDNLFVIMMLSPNYYSSPVCLNEMGAAWVKKCEYQCILLPDFGYADIKGVVNPNTMSFKLSDKKNRNQALSEFKDRIVAHLGLPNVDHGIWERFREKFVTEIDQLSNSL